jgi:hypothetical protein
MASLDIDRNGRDQPSVIHKTGLISRRTMEMNISTIETIDVERGMIGRQ